MVNWLKIVSIVLKVPLGLFVLASFGGSIYAAAYKIQGISWGTPAIMGGLILLFVIGWFLGRKNYEVESSFQTQSQPQFNGQY
jgi:hypothetical protein